MKNTWNSRSKVLLYVPHVSLTYTHSIIKIQPTHISITDAKSYQLTTRTAVSVPRKPHHWGKACRTKSRNANRARMCRK
jgi:hypothetical protein